MSAPDPTPCQVSALDWHAPSARERRAAATLCQACPIQLQCAEEALERREVWGVWGGFDFEDMARNAQRRLDAPRATPWGTAQHGTVAGYSAHLRRREAACEPCLAAERARWKTRHDPRRRTTA